MAIEIKESFRVDAPIESVWQFMLDPARVATCMPGATLEEVIDPRSFIGTVQVRLGAITTRYQGRVQMTQIDESAHSVQMTMEGRETGGGTARGTMTSQLRSSPEGQTQVVTHATIDLTGRVMQMGRGMIQGVSSQLFKQFVARTRETLESSATGEDLPAPVPDAPEAIRIVPLILRTIWAAIRGFFRRSGGRSEPRARR